MAIYWQRKKGRGLAVLLLGHSLPAQGHAHYPRLSLTENLGSTWAAVVIPSYRWGTELWGQCKHLSLLHCPPSMGDRIERGNASLTASYITADLSPRCSNLFRRPCFSSTPRSFPEAVVFACKLHFEQLEWICLALNLSQDPEENNRTGSVLWLRKNPIKKRSDKSYLGEHRRKLRCSF